MVKFIADFQFNRDKKQYLIQVDNKGLIDINIYRENTEICLFTELGITDERLTEILIKY